MKNERIYIITPTRSLVAFLPVILLAVLSACSVKKYIPEDENLYQGADLEITYPKDESKDKQLNLALNEAVVPKPNSKLLGVYFGLWAHYKVESDNDGFISRFINKKFGEKPVYESDVNLSETEKLLVNRLVNRGHFFPEIQSSMQTRKIKTEAIYKVQVGTPYRLESYQYLSDTNTSPDDIIKEALAATYLVENSKFNLGDLKREMIRIDKYLKERGYYYFNSRYLTFRSDTNHYDHRGFDIYLELTEDAPREKLVPYTLGSVTVFSSSEISSESTGVDSAFYQSISYVQYPEWVKPKYIQKHIITVPDSLYRQQYAQTTARRLSSLGAYQHANIQFSEDDDSSGSNEVLNARISLTPARKFSVRTGTNVYTKSTGFAGPGLNLTFQNRNLFKGAEVLEIQGVMGYEFQINRGSSRGLNNFEFRLENSLTFPRLLAPFIKFNPYKAYSIPNTRVSLSFDFQQRSLYYSLTNLYGALSYDWFANSKVRWQITPLSLNYMLVYNQTDEFNDIIAGNPFLARSLSDQFIPANSVNYRYSELNDLGKINRFYVSLSLEQAGFLTGNLNADTLFGLPFAQYLKSDIDFRYDLKIRTNHHIVNRVFVGVGYPYGNSASLPYSRQYFSGGPNSVRAFLVRSLGPGGFVPMGINNTTFFDQAGDIRLEFNSEYRFPILGYLKGAVFVDAGNIWLMNKNPSLPNGQFSADWYKQLGVGTGFGFRLDVDVLVVRLDLSHAIGYPSREFRDFWLSDSRLGGLIWNFAIGYPF